MGTRRPGPLRKRALRRAHGARASWSGARHPIVARVAPGPTAARGVVPQQRTRLAEWRTLEHG